MEESLIEEEVSQRIAAEIEKRVAEKVQEYLQVCPVRLACLASWPAQPACLACPACLPGLPLRTL